jgi:hypothetical protein
MAAAKTARSVTISGTIPEASSSTTLDLTDNAAGNGQGWITVNGQKIRIVQIGNINYFEAGLPFWSKYGGGSSVAQLFAGKWVKSSGANSPAASFSEFTNARKFIAALANTKGTFVKAGTATIHGQKAYAIKAQGAGGGGVLYVNATGKPYPLEITSPSSAGKGEITFSNWNKPVTIKAPAHSIDLNSLNSSSPAGG